eukprot:7056646-Pyramimonas_sp.AAC.1
MFLALFWAVLDACRTKKASERNRYVSYRTQNIADSSGYVGGHLGALLGRLGGRVGHRAPISDRRGITLGQLKALSNYLGVLCELSWAVSSLSQAPEVQVKRSRSQRPGEGPPQNVILGPRGSGR